MGTYKTIIGIALLCLFIASTANATLEGYAEYDFRVFPHKALFPGQDDADSSLILQPELHSYFSKVNIQFSFIPFLRINDQDSERSHADIRELALRGNNDSFEWTAGIAKVFWGVTESQHLVDIVNQTDLVEEPDLEVKLGQPMLGLTWVQDWGHIEGYALPGFRERTFAGEQGRLRTRFVIDQDNPLYESSKENRHIDAAIRAFTLKNDTELGLSYFYGTSRDPEFQPTIKNSTVMLRPYYVLIQQVGLDVLHLAGNWTWKFEGYQRTRKKMKNYHATTTGFEYTYTGGAIKGSDVSFMLEYMYDSRDEAALTPFEHDIFAGMRIALNDLSGTDIRANVIIDINNNSTISTLEISRRMSDFWKVTFLMRSYGNMSTTDYIYDFRNDDYINLKLTRYF